MRRSISKNQGFETIEDPKLRLLANALADKIDNEARTLIMKAYTDPGIQARWEEIRRSGQYQKGGKIHRKVLEVPVIVNDFLCDYFGDPGWQKNKKLWKHELVKPWLVVEKI